MKKSLLLLGLVAALGFTASAQTPYAYGLKTVGITDGTVETGTEAITVDYTLNAAATGVAVEIYNGTELVKTVDLSAEAANLAVGAHEVSVPIADLAAGVQYTWKVNVQSPAITTPTAFSHAQYTFWSPYGIAVDNNPESDHFGRILVTECQPNMNTDYWTKTEGVGVGVYAFDPQLERIKNAKGTYGFNGGLTWDNYKYKSGNRVFSFKKVRISKDGRIFVGSMDMGKNPIYEIDPENLDAWTPLFEGKLASADSTNGNIVDAEGKFIGGLSVAFDLTGEGENLKLVNLSGTQGQAFAFGNFLCYQYNLGTAKSINTAVTEAQEVLPLSLQYTISAQSASIAYDKDGGIWYSQYRGTPSDQMPAFVHATAAGDEDYKDITTVARGGGVGFNKDYSILALPTANNEVTLFTVDKDADGKPVLTKLVSFASLRGCNDIAFDWAGNFYTCDNGKEKFGGWAIPQTLKAGVIAKAGENGDPAVVTPAASKYAFTVASVTGVNDVKAAGANITAGVGFIEVAGAQRVQIYSINGTLMSTSHKAELPAGVYVVRADGKACKVLVK